jgi:hypothetical protein
MAIQSWFGTLTILHCLGWNSHAAFSSRGLQGLQGWPTARVSGWWQLAGETKSTSVENWKFSSRAFVQSHTHPRHLQGLQELRTRITRIVYPFPTHVLQFKAGRHLKAFKDDCSLTTEFFIFLVQNILGALDDALIRQCFWGYHQSIMMPAFSLRFTRKTGNHSP